VADVCRFLEAVRQAGEQGMKWVEDLARALLVEQRFQFTPESFEAQLKEAVAPLVERMAGGTFYVRLERRGFKGRIISPEVERAGHVSHKPSGRARENLAGLLRGC
jgi:hypothetical protein